MDSKCQYVTTILMMVIVAAMATQLHGNKLLQRQKIYAHTQQTCAMPDAG